ncbi:hypothetical protein Q1695_013196 [Nippostrongylus brasiliensis]|nr:hypothetical protein Q1695_013196 [Nippostrongylus brasiliensis]
MMLITSFFCALLVSVYSVEIDPKGYIIFCPCMGRYGNQVDQLLGVMRFSKELDRTLVLPNFIEYPFPNTVMVPFESVFSVTEIEKYMKVIKMVTFIRDVMPVIWPPERRTAICRTPRMSIYDENAPTGCHPKEGNPFGPYWDKVGISFVDDAYFGDLPGGYDLTVSGSKAAWLERFPSSIYPVLAFPSPPAPSPSRSTTWELQRYLKWSTRILEKAGQFMRTNLVRPFVGIHLRSDNGWARVCEHLPTDKRPLFASMQCDGEEYYDGQLTKEICSPSAATVVEQVVDVVGKIGAKSVFVASVSVCGKDHDNMIESLNEALSGYEVKAHRLNPDDALVSLAILGRADHFIGNCVSTFSHIVKRERSATKARRPTSYFGIRGETRRIEL